MVFVDWCKALENFEDRVREETILNLREQGFFKGKPSLVIRFNPHDFEDD